MRRIALLFALGCASSGGGDASSTSPTGDTSGADGADVAADTAAGPGDGSDATDATDGTDATDAADGTDATDATDGADGSDGAQPTVTWHGRIRAIVQTQCAGCHTEGGAGPFPLDTYDQVAAMAPALRASIDAGRMPPWMPDTTCRPMVGERVLAPDERTDLLAWLGGDAVEGDPATFVAPDVPEPPAQPDLSLRAVDAYVPSRKVPDDYRCLVLDHTFDAPTFLTGFDVTPDQRPIVHHVLLYMARDTDLEQLQAMDDAEPGPGYTCYGGPGIGSGETLGGWVPGSVGFHLPDGVALEVAKGSRLIMQVHYNTTAIPKEQEIPADRSTVNLWTLPEGTWPTHLARILPFANTGIAIAPGDAESVQTMTYGIPVPGTVIGTVPHMHTLGKRLTVSLERDGAEPQCIVDVPRWDFSWQQFYLYDPAHYVQALPGDRLKLTCVYDNSAANQPVINGVQVAPREVHWGEGTLDEMCLDYAIIRTPYLPPDGSSVCPGFAPCAAACPEGDASCMIDCASYAGFECAECVLSPLGTCASQVGCATELGELLTCLNTCQDDSLVCLSQACGESMDAVWTCLGPKAISGACDDVLTDCDVTFGK